MNTPIRLFLTMVSCASLSGCPFTSEGVVARAVYEDLSRALQWDAWCRDSSSKGLVVTEPPDIAIATDEGEVSVFEPAKWRFQRQARIEYLDHPVEGPAGRLAITERAVYFVPSNGGAGVRIPYPAVLDVVWRPDASSVIVASCGGRLDEFTFPEEQGTKTKAVADKLKARIVAPRAQER